MLVFISDGLGVVVVIRSVKLMIYHALSLLSHYVIFFPSRAKEAKKQKKKKKPDLRLMIY